MRSLGARKSDWDILPKREMVLLLAEYDLHDRSGKCMARNKSGMMQLRLATLKDIDLLKQARGLARGIDFCAISEALSEKVGKSGKVGCILSEN